jgi:hypothetical protein
VIGILKKIRDPNQKFTSDEKIQCQIYIRSADNYPCRGRQTYTFFSGQKIFCSIFPGALSFLLPAVCGILKCLRRFKGCRFFV